MVRNTEDIYGSSVSLGLGSTRRGPGQRSPPLHGPGAPGRRRGPRPQGAPEPLSHGTDSDSLNISQRARWVVCPLDSTQGNGRRAIYPRRVREYRTEDLI